MTRATLRWAGAWLILAATLLAGCGTGYRLDNTVQSFSSLPTLPPNPTYRFERLPSQQQLPGQTELEALADPALFRAGLRRDDAAPRYSVQVSARAQRVLSPWADPWDYGWGWGGGFGFHSGVGLGVGYGAPLFPRWEQPWYHREVAVIVRDIASNRVVFESRAVNDGPWMDNNTVIAAMFDAALHGFPNPPAGVRRVDVQVGGTQQARAAAPAAAPAPAASAPAR
ncbi:DUF4136 domain-containing protein [Ramlibacter tataouinensis]|uniref:DUF4136 domain-containing protein n=1 Tax=Ramlibacter tataouinensis (strain ATCC BAA-407 / DSM 14655 / LMG 21543 / TTB310) TaxID=365046 RepID=F5XXJ7_RAMTT|nr:DUF4136 domain-containing protein [Ramlibacter tataouinensis]AEG91800.1 Conserved hypothetical protein [Ramlibacter tataouinensis TTB310]